MNKIEILERIAEISPLAKDYVESCFESAVVMLSSSDGIFLKVVSDDLRVYYANFGDDTVPDVAQIIEEELEAEELKEQEICFNVHGRNTKIISVIQDKGFILDMAGYVLKFTGPTPAEDNLPDTMRVQGFSAQMGDEFADLFDRAYEQLNRDNGWPTKSYSLGAAGFCATLLKLNEQGRVRSFWIGDVLIGAYITEKEYISDIVVDPRYQNQGYGSLLLNHCLRFMHEENPTSHIYLRVTESNVGAKRFYERNGFHTVSHFAEHTYRR